MPLFDGNGGGGTTEQSQRLQVLLAKGIPYEKAYDMVYGTSTYTWEVQEAYQAVDVSQIDDTSSTGWVPPTSSDPIISGCTNPTATNYNPSATIDDGSCVFAGEGGGGGGEESIVSPSIPSALPSLPSISNVGSVPFTGTVSTIPGGFQPLPQTAGGRKKLYQLSQFHGGINQKSSPRDISDQECQEAVNVTFSNVGRIKLLGDCLNTDNPLKEFPAVDGAAGAPLSGYGLFEFTAPVDLAGNNPGVRPILLTSDGDEIDALCDNDGDGDDDTVVGWINFAGTGATDVDVAPVFYAAGSGVYVCDAFFGNANTNKAKIYVYRKDINGSVPVSGWVEGGPLIPSPEFHLSSATCVEVHNAAADAGANGRMEVIIINTGTGTWAGAYHFYASWLFDGGCETGLSLITGADDFGSGGEGLEFNVSIKHTSASPLGGNKRIEGARIYFKKVGDTERFLLAEVSLIDGVKGALDSTFIPWNTADSGNNIYDMGTDASTQVNITFDAPPEVYTYASLNGYYANEVYTKSPDVVGTRATPSDVRYKTAVVGSGSIVFIGNVKFDGRDMPDSMMFSMPGKPGLFPKYNRFDSPSSDGSPITALAAFKDTILQFKQNGMYVINVSNPAQFYAQSSFRDCGVFNPCQVFTTSFGVIFVNKYGCFIYDGQKVISLTNGKFDWKSQSGIEEVASEVSGSKVPCVGYDPSSQNIIVLKNIGDSVDSTDEDNGWVYNMTTQSWTEGSDMITNAANTRLSNFIITSHGYLSIKSNQDATLLNYNHDKLIDTGAQTITYWTKDLDFGLPSQTKFLYKVYVTYKGKGDTLTCGYGVNGETDVSDLYSFSVASRGGTTDSTPLENQSSDENLETWHVRTLYPDDLTEGKEWQSISLYFNGEVDSTFEINDIAILYRVRPIK